ncbi:unnamed protein product [Caenorhabditis brenneri]
MAQAPPNKMKCRPDPPFLMDGDYTTYVNSSVKERVEILRNQCIEVHRPQENYFKAVAREHNRFRARIQADPELKEWKHDFMTEKDSGVLRRILAQRTLLALCNDESLKKKDEHLVFGRKQKELTPPPPGFDPKKYDGMYRTPDVRFQITSNLTFNKYNPIPVYCDVSQSLHELKTNIPDTLAFQYINVNVVDPVKEIHLANAIEMANESPNNRIRCDCHSRGQRCDRVACPCFYMNNQMTMLQYKHLSVDDTEFGSLKPILFKHSREMFYGYCGFSCSKACGCDGKCDLNAMFLIEKNLFPLEIFRPDPIIGFGIRSPVFIPAGTPVMEFTGEIMSRKRVGSENNYTYQCSYHNDDKWRLFLGQQPKFNDNYRKLLLALHQIDYYVDPTFYGNVGRMAAHSCCPNMEMIRIFRESLSPAHLSFVMVTLEDVFPGTPLTIDYGSLYELESCKCNSFACRSGPNKDVFKKFNTLSLTNVIRKIHNVRRQNFQRSVLDPMQKFANKTGRMGT